MNLKRKAAKTLSYFLLPLSITLWFLNFRIFLIECIDNIGHLALEPDCYLKECFLNKKKRFKTIIIAPTKNKFYLFPRSVCCNDYLAKLWKQHFYVVTSPLLSTIMFLMSLHKWLRIDTRSYARNYTTTIKCYNINKLYNGPPLLSLDNFTNNLGSELLLKIGVPKYNKYIVFANRDSSFRKCDSIFSFRNNDINRYHLAIKELVRQGFYCIRMGDQKSQPINWDLYTGLEDKVIDYSRSEYKKKWMDIFLVAHSTFLLIGSTGLSYLATLFQIPLLLVEQTPFCHFPQRFTDIYIPKLYVNQKTNQFISFKEILNSKMKYFIFDEEFKNENIVLRSPTDEEILDGVHEMLQQLNTNDYSKTDLQQIFDRIECQACYSFPPAAKISHNFLKKFEYL